MEKTCETQLWDEKQNRALFLDHPAVAISFSGNQHKLGNGKKIGASICSPSSVGISLTVTARRIFSSFHLFFVLWYYFEIERIFFVRVCFFKSLFGK